MESKRLFRIAANFTEALSLTCVILAYAGAYTLIAWCPSIGWASVGALVVGWSFLIVPKAYFSKMAREGTPWIENTYQCPECGTRWLDFDDSKRDGVCFECGEENVKPLSSRPFV